MKRFHKKSATLQSKLDHLLKEDPIIREIDAMVSDSQGINTLKRFSSASDFLKHLTEGALLNVTTIGSKALSLPCGEYMVMASDAGHTMLVPIGNTTRYKEVFEGINNEFEITTNKLVGNWHNIEKVLTEDDDKSDDDETNTPAKKFKSKVDPATVDRSPMLRAMEQQGHTVTSLAKAVGVDTPAISRLLRTPKDRQGDPGGRNPSIGTASSIANELRMDVEALFPDIFGVPQGDLGPREQKGNRGSGMKGAAAGSAKKGKSTQKWTQGNSSS